MMHDFLKTIGKIAFAVLVGVVLLFRPQWYSIAQNIDNQVRQINPYEWFLEITQNEKASEVPTGEVVSVVFSPPQYVYFCFELADLSTLISAPTIADARAWFELFRIPDKTGLPRCDYLVNNDTLEYVKVSRLENLRQVPTRFAGPTATPLPATGAVYQGRDGSRDYYVYLASASQSSAIRFLKYDFITAAFGPQP